MSSIVSGKWPVILGCLAAAVAFAAWMRFDAVTPAAPRHDAIALSAGGTSPAPSPRRPVDPERGANPRFAPKLAGWAVDTAHYDVSTDVSEKVAADAALLLERAWPIWCKRFGLDSSYDPGPGVFSVRIFANPEAFRKAQWDEARFTGPCLGFVDFMGFRLFALHQGDAYEMRRVLLHEGTHQFLYRLIGTIAAEALPRWYDEGCAHESEKHVLDGDRLELFQDRGGSFSWQAEDARHAFSDGRWSVKSLLASHHNWSEWRSRSCGWALVHFMRCSGDAKRAAWFSRWEEAVHSRSFERIPALVAELGSMEALTASLIAYLQAISAKAESRR